ncbi:MAG: hypothetical protein IPN19_01945 [Elusimicrobia bacterium]|nr:hypothetical protein [Elusimicrobiota bacterium]
MTLNQTKAHYDEQGRATSYTNTSESSILPGVIESLEWSGGQYNNLGQLTANHETIKKPIKVGGTAVETETNRTNIVYDARGLKTGHEENTTTSDKKVHTNQILSNQAYTQGGFVYSNQLVNTRTGNSGGNTLNLTTHQNRISTTYDNGRLTKTEDQIVSSAESDVTRTVTTELSNFDPRGRAETKNETTIRTTADGRLNDTITVNRDKIKFDDRNRETGFEEKTTSNGSPNLTTTVTRSEVTFDDTNNLATGYKEVTEIKGTILDQTSTLIKSDIVSDEYGRTTAYDQTETSGVGTTSFYWTATGFNDFSQITGWTETNGTNPFGTFNKTTSLVKYDDQERRLSYREVGDSVKEGPYTKNWLDGQYNSSGQLKSHKESGNSWDAGIYSKEWNGDYADAYDVHGRQNHFVETLTRTFATGVVGRNRTSVREWKNSAYNGDGLLTGYQEISTVAIPTISKTVADRTYEAKSFDSEGRAILTTERTDTDYYDPNEFNRKLYEETNTRNWDGVYYPNGLLKSFNDTNTKTVDDVSGAQPVQVTNFTSSVNRTEINYTTDKGYLASYKETGNNAGATFTRNWTASTFDTQGRATTYTETGSNSSSGVNELVRNNITYTTDGFLEGYHEEGISGNQFTNRDWGVRATLPKTTALATPVVYDVLGRNRSFQESGWTDSGRYEKKQTNITYNPLNQTAGYLEEGWNLQQASYHKEWSNGIYDINERAKSYHQEVTSFGKTTKTDWLATTYNTLGQLMGYTDNGSEWENETKKADLTTTWTAAAVDGYNDVGQQQNYTVNTVRTGLDGSGTTTTDREWTNGEYVGGRLNSYRETVDTTKVTAEEERITKQVTVREATDYYVDSGTGKLKGMVAGYRETQISSNANEKPVQVIVDTIQYESGDGRQVGQTTVSAEGDLVSTILRLFEEWLSGFTEVAGVIVVPLNSLTQTLASLLSFGATTLTKVTDWISGQLPQEPLLPRLLELVNALPSLITDKVTTVYSKVLAALGSLPALTAKIDFLFSEAVSNKEDLKPIFDNDKLTSAYENLRPFDYTLTITQKKNVIHDDRLRPIQWTEITKNSAAKEKNIESTVAATYSGDTQKYETYSARVQETGINADGDDVNKLTNMVRCNYSYDSQDQPTGYAEMTFEGNSLEITRDKVKTDVDWANQTQEQKVTHAQDILSGAETVKQIVAINEYSNVAHDATGKMTDYDVINHKYGETYQDFAELGSVSRSITELNDLIALQAQKITTAETTRTARLTEWKDEVTRVKTALNLTTVDDPTDDNSATIIAAIKAIYETRIKAEAQAERELVLSNQQLDVAIDFLSTKHAELKAADTSLDNAVADWKTACDRIQTWIINWENTQKTVMETKVAELKTFSLKDYVTQGVKDKAVEYETALTNFTTSVETWKTKYTDAKNKLNEWNWDSNQVDMTVALHAQLNGWTPIQTLTDVNDTHGAAIKTNLDNLIEKGVSLNDEINNLITTADTGLQAVKTKKEADKTQADKDLNGDGTETNPGTAALFTSAAIKLKDELLSYPMKTIDSIRLSRVLFKGKLIGVLAGNHTDNLNDVFLSPDGDNATLIVTDTYSKGEYPTPVNVSGTISRKDIVLAVTNMNKTWAPDVRISIDLPLIAGTYSLSLDYWRSHTYGFQDTLTDLSYGNSQARAVHYVDSMDARDSIDSDTNLVKNLSELTTALDAEKRIAKVGWDYAVLKGFSTLTIGDGVWAKYLFAQSAKNQDVTDLANATTALTTASNNLSAAETARDTTLSGLQSSLNSLKTSLASYLDSPADATGTKQRTETLTSDNGKVKDLKDKATVWNTARESEVTARQLFSAKTSALKTVTETLGKTEEGHRDLQTRYDFFVDASQDVAALTTEKSELEAELDAVKARAVVVLGGSTFLIDEKEVTLTTAQVNDLTNDQSIQIVGIDGDWTLAKLDSSDNVEVKVSAAEMRTTARRNVQFDPRGLVNSYTELSFDGTTIQIIDSITQVASAPVQWSSLSPVEKNNIVSETLKATLGSADGSISITKVLSQEFNKKDQVVRQVSRIDETNREGGETRVNKRQILTENMNYDTMGNLTTYRKATMEYPEGTLVRGKLTFEETRDSAGIKNLKYDDKNRLTESWIQTTEVGPKDPILETENFITPSDRLKALLDEGFGGNESAAQYRSYTKTTQTYTKNTRFNDLDQAIQSVRVTTEGDKATIEVNLADTKYNEQNRVVYSRSRIIETATNKVQSILTNIDAIKAKLNQSAVTLSDYDGATGKVMDSESWGHIYYSSGLLKSHYRRTNDGKRVVLDQLSYEYVNGQVSKSTTVSLEAGKPNNSVTYRFTTTVRENMVYNDDGFIGSEKRTTTANGKTTVETVTDMAYDAKGRLIHSKTATNETLAGVGGTHSFEVFLDVHKYNDVTNKIERQTRTTIDENKKTIETNAEGEVPALPVIEYEDDRIVSQTMRVTEQSIDGARLDTNELNRTQWVTQKFTYDSTGQVTTSRRLTREYNSTANPDFTAVVDESSSYTYDTHGRAVETVTLTKTSEYAGDERATAIDDFASLNHLKQQITSSVTRGPPSGFGDHGRLKRFVTVNWEGEKLPLVRITDPEDLSWSQLDESEKMSLLAGTLRSNLKKTVVVSFMDGVTYDAAGRMSTWRAQTRTMVQIPQDRAVGLSELIRSVFFAEGVSAQVFDSNSDFYLGIFDQFFLQTKLLYSGNSIKKIADLTTVQRTALLRSILTDTPWTYEGADYGAGTLKVFDVTLDDTTSVVRKSTTYDGLGQAESYQDLTVAGNGLIVDGQWHSFENGPLLDNLVAKWTALNGAVNIEANQVAELRIFLPNNTVTWTSNSNMKYLGGKPVSWDTTKKEFQLALADLPVGAAQDKVKIRINSSQTNNRMETKYDPAHEDREIASKEINSGPEGSTTIWTFTKYETAGDRVRAKEVFRIIKDTLTGSNVARWSAEKTTAQLFVSYDKQDAFKQIEVKKYNDITMKVSEAEGALITYVEQKLPWDTMYAQAVDSAWDRTPTTRDNIDTTVFDYDEININQNKIPRLKRATVFRNPANAISSMEDTYYIYADNEALRPIKTRTVTVLNPETETIDNVKTYKSKSTDIKTVEDASLSYDAHLRLGQSEVYRISHGGGETFEKSVFTYDTAGRVGEVDKQTFSPVGLTRTVHDLSPLVPDFKIKAEGTLITRELTINDYDFRRVSATNVFTQKSQGFTQAERTVFEYDANEQVQKSQSTLIEGIPLLSSSIGGEIADKADYRTFNFVNDYTELPRTQIIRDQYVYETTGESVGLATSYLERISSSASLGQFTVKKISGIAYNDRRLASSITEEFNISVKKDDTNKVVLDSKIFETQLQEERVANAQGALDRQLAKELVTSNIISQKTVTLTAGVSGAPATSYISLSADLSAYDARGNLQSLTRVTKEGGTQTTEYIQHKFDNSSGNILNSWVSSSKVALENNVAKPAIYAKTSEEELEYNDFDIANRLARVTKQTRKILDDKRLTVEVDNLTHDSQGRVRKIFAQIIESDTFANGTKLSKSYHVTTEADGTKPSKGFDSWGRLVDFVRTTKEDQLYRKETVSVASMAKDGQVLESTTTIEETGTAPSQSIHHIYTVHVVNNYVPLRGWLQDSTRTTTDEGKKTTEVQKYTSYDIKGRARKIETDVTEEDTLTAAERSTQPDDVLLKKSQTVTEYADSSFNTLGQTISWVRTIKELHPTKSPTETRKTTTETVSGATYDIYGRLSGQSTIVHEKSNLTESLLDRTYNYTTQLTYNNLNQVIEQIKTQKEFSNNKITIESVSEMKYNLKGQLISSQAIVQEKNAVVNSIAEGEQLNSVKKIVTTGNTYDVLGRMTETHRVTYEGPINGANSDKKSVEEVVSDMKYYSDGLLKSSKTTLSEKFPNQDKTYSTLIMSGMAYNAVGQMTSFNRTLKKHWSGQRDTDKTVTTDTINNIAYNNEGQMTGQTTVSRETGKKADGTVVADRFTQTILSAQTYNNLGQSKRGITVTKEFATKEVDEDSFDLSKATPIKTTTEEVDMDTVYDVTGRMTQRKAKTKEEGADPDATGSLEKYYVQETLGMTYSPTGVVLGFDRRTTEYPTDFDHDAGRATREATTQDLIYDGQGRITKQITEITESGSTTNSILDNKKTQTLFNQGFDFADRVTQSTTVSLKDDGTRYVKVKNTDMVFDNRGLLINYIKETQEGQGFDAIKEETISPLIYNSLGRITESKTRTTDAGKVTETITNTTKYNKLGLALMFDRTTSEYAENWATTPEKIKEIKEETVGELEYNALGQQKASTLKQTEKGGFAFYKQDLDVEMFRNTLKNDSKVNTLLLTTLGKTVDQLSTLSAEDLVTALNSIVSSPSLCQELDGQILTLPHEINQLLVQQEQLLSQQKSLEFKDLSLLNRSILRVIYAQETRKSPEKSLTLSVPFYHETTVETRVSKFDNEGRVARQNRTTTDGSKVTNESSVGDITYDDNGRFYSSASQVIDTAKDVAGTTILDHTVINRILSSNYNSKGRLVEQGKEREEFGKMVLETMTISAWDGVGRVTKTLVQSEERANLNSAENMIHHFFDTETTVTLNKMGQVTTSTTEMFNDSGAHDRVSTNVRSDFTYDTLGRATKYTETLTSTAGPQRMTKIEKLAIQYDLANRPITWSESSNPLILDAKGGVIDLSQFSFSEADLKKASAPEGTPSSLIDLTLEGLADLLANNAGEPTGSLANLGNSSLLSIFEMILKPAVEQMARAKMGNDHYSDSFRDFIVNGLLAEITSLETAEGEDIISWTLGDFMGKLMRPVLGGNSSFKYDVVYSKTISDEIEAILANDVSNEEKTLSQLVADNVYSDTSKTLKSILKDLFTAAIAKNIPGISKQVRESDIDNMLNLTSEFIQVIPPAVEGEDPTNINWIDKTLQNIVDAVAGGSSPPILNFRLKNIVKKLEFEISIENPTLDLTIDELADGPNASKTLSTYLSAIIASGMKSVNKDDTFTEEEARNLAYGMLARKETEFTGPTSTHPSDDHDANDAGRNVVPNKNYLNETLSSIKAIVKSERLIYPVSGQSTVGDLLHNLVFSGAGALTIKEWHSRIFKNNLPSLTLKNSSSAFSTSFGDLMGHMFKAGTESWLIKINSALQGALQDYTNKTKTSTQITGISYDPDGRLLTRSEIKSWKDIGGGGDPGLDSKWKNAQATVNTRYYYGISDLYIGQAVEATKSGAVTGNHDDSEVQRDGIDLKYVEGDIKYNQHGQTASMWSVAVAPTGWWYSFVKKNWRTTKNKDNYVHTNPLDRMATVTQTFFDQYDRQGRPLKTHSSWIKDDIMRSHGTTNEDTIVYDDLGQKIRSNSSSHTVMDRSIDGNGNDGYNFTPPLGQKIIDEWSNILTSWTGKFNSLVTGKSPYDQANDAPGPRYAHRKTNTLESSKNNYVYDLFGNLDADATRNKSSREVSTWDDGDGALSPLAKALNVAIQVVTIVIMVVISVLSFGAATAAALAIYAAVAAAVAATSSLASSGLNGVKFGKALGLAAIQAAAAFVSTYAGGAASGFGEVAKALIMVATNVVASVGSAAIMGARGDDLWRTALAGAVAGLAGPISNGLGGGIVARVLVAAALNIAAARIEGVKNGNQLLLIGALAGATEAVASVGGFKQTSATDNKNTISNNVRTAIARAVTSAIVGYALGLVIANNIRGPTGQAIAAFVAVAVTAALRNQDTIEMSAEVKDDKGKIKTITDQKNFTLKGLGDNIFKGMEHQNASKGEEKPVTLRYGPGEKNVETQLKDISRQRSKEERVTNAVTQQLFSSARFFGEQISTVSKIATDLLQGKNPFVSSSDLNTDNGQTNNQTIHFEGHEQGTYNFDIDLNNSESPLSLIMNLFLGSLSNAGLVDLVLEDPSETTMSNDILEVDLDNTSFQSTPETMTAKSLSIVNSMDMSPLSLFSARDSVKTNDDSSFSSRGKMDLGSDIDVSKLQIRLDSRESNFTTIRTSERKIAETVLSKEQIESVFASVKGVKVDRSILNDYKTQAAIAKLKDQGLIDRDATLIGVRINGLAAVVAVKDNRIVGALFGNAAGQNEFRSFTKIQFNDKGQVMKAEGKIHREIGGKFEVRGSFVYAAKGSQEYQMAMTRAENLVQSAEALAVIKQADAVYTEKNNEGNVARQVYIGKDEQGGARVLASEHLMTDGSMRMLTYDYALTGQEKSEGVLAKGKIYESKGFNEKYGAAAIGEFKIQKVGANVVMTASIGMAIVAQLGIGGHERIVYEETTTKGKREISMNAATGGLEYVYEKGPDGSGRVVVFGDKAPVAPGVQVVKFSDLQANEQDQVLASLPAMDSRDPALITQQLVKMSEALNAAVAIKKLGEALGMEVKDVFLQLPEGMATELGLPKGTILNVTNMRMDENNEVILEGTLTSKDLKAEKNFILVGSASTIAGALGQKNDTKGAQLLLIQEKGGYRAVTYVPDANAKCNVRVLNTVDVVSPEIVRTALKETKNMGGFGAKPGLMEKAAEKAKEVIKDIPGADTIKELPKLERSLDILPVPGLRLMPLRLGPLGRSTTEDKASVLLASTEEAVTVDNLADYAYALFLEPARTIPGSGTWLAWAGVADSPVVRVRGESPVIGDQGSGMAATSVRPAKESAELQAWKADFIEMVKAGKEETSARRAEVSGDSLKFFEDKNADESKVNWKGQDESEKAFVEKQGGIHLKSVSVEKSRADGLQRVETLITEGRWKDAAVEFDRVNEAYRSGLIDLTTLKLEAQEMVVQDMILKEKPKAERGGGLSA